mgnify:CR=1 FL=1
MSEKVRYSDAELEEFRQVILQKLELAKRDYDEIMPWEHLDYAVTKDFLIKENQTAHENKTTPNCREKCSNCGAMCYGEGVCFEKR